MSFASASPSAPGKRSGKQNGHHFGVRGSAAVPKGSFRGVVQPTTLPAIEHAEIWGFATVATPNAADPMIGGSQTSRVKLPFPSIRPELISR
jgi:hypothetical protein